MINLNFDLTPESKIAGRPILSPHSPVTDLHPASILSPTPASFFLPLRPSLSRVCRMKRKTRDEVEIEEVEEEVEHEEEEVEEEEVEIKWVKHYASCHLILLVGEGDFSFSLSFANIFGSAENMVATSLDSEEKLFKRYKNARHNLTSLRDLGAKLLHQVDAKNMSTHQDLMYLKFDRIIYNFPHAGFKGPENSTKMIKVIWKNFKLHRDEEGFTVKLKTILMRHVDKRKRRKPGRRVTQMAKYMIMKRKLANRDKIATTKMPSVLFKGGHSGNHMEFLPNCPKFISTAFKHQHPALDDLFDTGATSVGITYTKDDPHAKVTAPSAHQLGTQLRGEG